MGLSFVVILAFAVRPDTPEASDFGSVSIVPNRFTPENTAYILDPEYASVGYLRNFRTEVLAKTGDAEKRMLLVEYGLKVRQQKSHAAIRDLATS